MYIIKAGHTTDIKCIGIWLELTWELPLQRLALIQWFYVSCQGRKGNQYAN